MAPLSLPPLSMRDRRADPAGFARAIGESYARFGFAIVRDHGLDRQTIARALASTKQFFALPDEKTPWPLRPKMIPLLKLRSG